jgi:putative membrane protein
MANPSGPARNSEPGGFREGDLLRPRPGGGTVGRTTPEDRPMLFAFTMTGEWQKDLSHIAMSLLAAAVFGVLGIILLAAGFKVFEKITPKLDVEAELAKGNVAVGIMVGALLLGMSLIVLMAIGG